MLIWPYVQNTENLTLHHILMFCQIHSWRAWEDEASRDRHNMLHGEFSWLGVSVMLCGSPTNTQHKFICLVAVGVSCVCYTVTVVQFQFNDQNLQKCFFTYIIQNASNIIINI